MTNFHIRDARLDERDAIREVTLTAYEQYAISMPRPQWEAYRDNIGETLANVSPAEQIVAEQASQIVGAVLLYPNEIVVDLADEMSIHVPSPEIRLLAVAPNARGQGVGKALVYECIRRARNAGATAITLHTTDIMQTAMRLYEYIGFRRDPEADWIPAPDLVVKGYRMDLIDTI